MKKYISILFAALSAFAVASCKKAQLSDIQPAEGKTFLFTATQENATKTGLDGLKVVWVEGDIVKLYFKQEDGTTGNRNATLVSVKEDGSATFKAEIPEGANLDAMYAVFQPKDGDPFEVKDAGKGVNKGRIVYQKSQTAVLNGFDPSAAPMVARYEKTANGEEPSFSFKNMASFVKLTVSGAKSVVFQGAKMVTGSYYWGLTQEGSVKISQSSADNPQEGVTLNAPEGEVLNGTYYIAVPPFDTEAGLTLKFTAEGGEERTLANTTAFAIKRNQVINLGTFNPFGKTFGVNKSGVQEVEAATTSFAFNVTGNVAWTATVDNGASLSTSEGTGAANVTVTLPENTTTDAKNYVVTVTTDDSEIPAEGRTKTFTICQAGVVVGVKFGHAWKTADYNAIKAVYTADATTTTFEQNMMTVTYSPGSNSIAANESSKGGYYLRGANLKATFVAGEAGDAVLSFRVRIAKPSAGNTRSIYVRKNGTQVAKITHNDSTADLWESYQVAVNGVEVGDVILIDCSGSGNNGLFMNDTYSVSWDAAPATKSSNEAQGTKVQVPDAFLQK